MPLTPQQKKLATQMRDEWQHSPGMVLKKCQKNFNMMIRMTAADDDGYCSCVVTGQPFHYKQIDAGHFISASRQPTRFDERNVHPQSKGSNRFDTTSDSGIFYTLFMGERYGRSVVNELIELSRTKDWKWCINNLIEMRLKWLDRIKIESKRLEG